MYIPISTNADINGNNTKNHEITVYPLLHIQFKIIVQINIKTSPKTKPTKLNLLKKELIRPVIAKIK